MSALLLLVLSAANVDAVVVFPDRAQVLRVTIGLMTILCGFEILYSAVEGSVLVAALLAGMVTLRPEEARAAGKINVVTSTTDLAALAQEVGVRVAASSPWKKSQNRL